MEILFITLSIILLVLLLFVFLRCRLYKKQVRIFTEQTLRRTDPDVDHPITVETFSKDFTQLADALNEYTGIYKRKIQQTEEKSQNLKLIIAGISHDFRTPLTASLGYLQMISRNAVLDDKNKDYLEIAISKNQYLKSLSDDFFEYSLLNTDHSKKEYTRFAIRPLLENITLSHYEPITGKGLDFIADLNDDEGFIYANEQDITRIIENLYSNAVKYASSFIKLESQSISGELVITMSNDIPYNTAFSTEHIFEPFRRNTDGSNSGNGLGLYVAMSLAQKNGGSLTAEFDDDRVFSITLKFKKADSKSSAVS